MNLLWSVTFFGFHNLELSKYIIVSLLSIVLYQAYIMWQEQTNSNGKHPPRQQRDALPEFPAPPLHHQTGYLSARSAQEEEEGRRRQRPAAPSTHTAHGER